MMEEKETDLPLGQGRENGYPEGRKERSGGKLVWFAMLVLSAFFLGLMGVVVGVNWERGNSFNGKNNNLIVAPDRVNTVAQRLSHSIVDVVATSIYQTVTTAGTGIVISNNGLILTNNHVIDGSTSITVQLDGTGPKYSARVVGEVPSQDIALLKASGLKGGKAVSLGNSQALQLGEPVVAIGNAYNLIGTPTVTSGVITALNRTITASDPTGLQEVLHGMLQMNISLAPGNSGGPLVNSVGEVVGMNTAASGMGAGGTVGFAIPISRAMRWARVLEAGKARKGVTIGYPAFLGVQVVDVTPGSGVKEVGVVDSLPSTPAAQIGLNRGSFILKINGKTVNSEGELHATILQFSPGQTISITWQNAYGVIQQKTCQLVAGPAD